MPDFCTAYGCTNAGYKLECMKKISFHRFPLKDPNLLKMWIIQIRRKDFHPNKYSRLCSAHFEDDCFIRNDRKSRKLKRYSVPTKFSYNLEEKLGSTDSNNLSGTLVRDAESIEISAVNPAKVLCKVCGLPASSTCHSDLKRTLTKVGFLVNQRRQPIEAKRKQRVLLRQQQEQIGKKKDKQELHLGRQSKETEETIEDESEDEINQLSNNTGEIQDGDDETITEDSIDIDDVSSVKSTNEKFHSAKQLESDSSLQRLKEEEAKRISALKNRLMSTVVKRSLKRALLESEIKAANARRDFYENKKSLLSLKNVESNTKAVPLSLTEQKILEDLKDEESAFKIEKSILQKQLIEAEKKASICIKTYYETKKSYIETPNRYS